jgi:hypothetical protein
MDQISMKNVPDWKCGQKYYRFIKTVFTNFTVDEKDQFDKFLCMKKYCKWKSTE